MTRTNPSSVSQSWSGRLGPSMILWTLPLLSLLAAFHSSRKSSLSRARASYGPSLWGERPLSERLWTPWQDLFVTHHWQWPCKLYLVSARGWGAWCSSFYVSIRGARLLFSMGYSTASLNPWGDNAGVRPLLIATKALSLQRTWADQVRRPPWPLSNGASPSAGWSLRRGLGALSPPAPSPRATCQRNSCCKPLG